jgi:hypothetical protein
MMSELQVCLIPHTFTLFFETRSCHGGTMIALPSGPLGLSPAPRRVSINGLERSLPSVSMLQRVSVFAFTLYLFYRC